jgi:ABC-type antimicrobial peptide transport system permease subunit
VRAALRRVEPNAGLEVATLYSSIGLAFLPSQVGAALLGGIGVLGLMLATIGLYGVMVYSVSRRTREIGVRLALGADRRDIAFMVLASAAKLILIGSAAGLLCAFFLVKPLAMFLVPGLRPSDPVSFLAVAAVLAITGLAAAWGPARRAAAVDPRKAPSKPTARCGERQGRCPARQTPHRMSSRPVLNCCLEGCWPARNSLQN